MQACEPLESRRAWPCGAKGFPDEREAQGSKACPDPRAEPGRRYEQRESDSGELKTTARAVRAIELSKMKRQPRGRPS